eukprot:CAMPEP_0168612114 /NCGR_PEP_ID=MMETSP0449_2-20121227/2731_1 /TAXON_ID=1082188 /ORGANISM="Strombidium rassoulzadegani, Strain ras09" /LENGTH=202 /DNA_ID=CAMNT_0008652631 /DNA_START=935 /DNA_END=1543 /DNA_ORIENTATION=-
MPEDGLDSEVVENGPHQLTIVNAVIDQLDDDALVVGVELVSQLSEGLLVVEEGEDFEDVLNLPKVAEDDLVVYVAVVVDPAHHVLQVEVGFVEEVARQLMHEELVRILRILQRLQDAQEGLAAVKVNVDFFDELNVGLVCVPQLIDVGLVRQLGRLELHQREEVEGLDSLVGRQEHIGISADERQEEVVDEHVDLLFGQNNI